MKILSLSDIVVPFIYSPQIRTRFNGIDIVIGCGDLPYSYLEFVISTLDATLFYVRGNHDQGEDSEGRGNQSALMGGFDLHRRAVHYKGILLAGVEGCLRYREGPFQYTQQEMWANVMTLLPRLFYNRVVHRRYLDIFVTHASPRGIHDQDDLPHQGIDAFRWLINRFQPRFHIHGHTHLYRPDEKSVTTIGRTQIINTYGFQETRYEALPAKPPET